VTRNETDPDPAYLIREISVTCVVSGDFEYCLKNHRQRTCTCSPPRPHDRDDDIVCGSDIGNP